MEARQLLDALSVAEKLKDTTRHCYTKNGRHEYELNKTYAYDKVDFSDYMKALRDAIKEDTLKKLGEI